MKGIIASAIAALLVLLYGTRTYSYKTTRKYCCGLKLLDICRMKNSDCEVRMIMKGACKKLIVQDNSSDICMTKAAFNFSRGAKLAPRSRLDKHVFFVRSFFVVGYLQLGESSQLYISRSINYAGEIKLEERSKLTIHSSQTVKHQIKNKTNSILVRRGSDVTLAGEGFCRVGNIKVFPDVKVEIKCGAARIHNLIVQPTTHSCALDAKEHGMEEKCVVGEHYCGCNSDGAYCSKNVKMDRFCGFHKRAYCRMVAGMPATTVAEDANICLQYTSLGVRNSIVIKDKAKFHLKSVKYSGESIHLSTESSLLLESDVVDPGVNMPMGTLNFHAKTLVLGNSASVKFKGPKVTVSVANGIQAENNAKLHADLDDTHVRGLKIVASGIRISEHSSLTLSGTGMITVHGSLQVVNQSKCEIKVGIDGKGEELVYDGNVEMSGKPSAVGPCQVSILPTTTAPPTTLVTTDSPTTTTPATSTEGSTKSTPKKQSKSDESSIDNDNQSSEKKSRPESKETKQDPSQDDNGENNDLSDAGNNGGSGGMDTPSIIAAVVGFTLLVAAIGGIVYFVMRRSKKQAASQMAATPGFYHSHPVAMVQPLSTQPSGVQSVQAVQPVQKATKQKWYESDDESESEDSKESDG